MLRTIRVPLCGQNVALAASERGLALHAYRRLSLLVYVAALCGLFLLYRLVLQSCDRWQSRPAFTIVVVATLALGRFALATAALDTGSPFGGMGASRDMTIAASMTT